LVAKEEETIKMVDGSAWEVINTGIVNVHAEMGLCMLWRRFGMSWRHDTILYP